MRARQPRTARPRMSARRRAPPASTQTTPRTDGTATRLEPANGTRGRGAHSARSRGEHRRESRGVRPRPSQAAPGKQGNLPGPLRRPRLEMSGGNGIPTRPASTGTRAVKKQNAEFRRNWTAGREGLRARRSGGAIAALLHALCAVSGQQRGQLMRRPAGKESNGLLKTWDWMLGTKCGCLMGIVARVDV